jgi:ATP-dependent protease HslVU (ClpYQ) ATPase subunit
MIAVGHIGRPRQRIKKEGSAINADYVHQRVAAVVKDENLSQFIL